MDKQASDVSLIFFLSSLTTHTESLALTHHISRAPFIFLRCSPFVAVPLPSCRLFLSRATSNLSRLADPSHQSPSFFDDVYFSSSFRNMLLFVPLSAVMSFLAALTTRRSLFSIRPYVVLRFSLYNIALHFSPSRRGCIRVSLSRARERLISARAVLFSARYRTVLAALASPSSIGCDEEKHALHPRCMPPATVSRSLSFLQRSLQSFSTSSSLQLSLSVGYQAYQTPASLLPTKNSSCHRSPSYYKHVMLSTHSHRYDI